MSEEQFYIIEQSYAIAIILVRGFFFGAFVNLFIDKEVLDRRKTAFLTTIIILEGLFFYMIPYETKFGYFLVCLLTIIVIFYFYNSKVLAHMIFVFFLWQNIFYIWHLINFTIFDFITDKALEVLDYSGEGAMGKLFFILFLLMIAQVLFLLFFFTFSYFIIRRICKKQYDMSLAEAVYLSIYSTVSYLIAYSIVQIMVVPLEKEVFVLLDEKKDLRFILPLIAILIFIGEMTAVATWQRYRRLKEEDLILQEQLQEQAYIRKKIEYTEKYHDKIRALRHDMAGKLMVLKSFLENHRYEEASDYLSEMNVELSEGAFLYATGNPVSDVVINEAAALSQKRGCRFECDFSFPKDKEISAMDVGIILSNLLDNALEAVSYVPEDKRYIELSGEMKNNFFLIRIVNPYDGVVEKGDDDSFKSRKVFSEESKNQRSYKSDTSLHGIGLKSVMNLADKYLGAVYISTADNLFEVKVMLQDSKNHQF